MRFLTLAARRAAAAASVIVLFFPHGLLRTRVNTPPSCFSVFRFSVLLLVVRWQDVFARLDPDEMCEALEPGLLAVVRWFFSFCSSFLLPCF